MASQIDATIQATHYVKYTNIQTGKMQGNALVFASRNAGPPPPLAPITTRVSDTVEQTIIPIDAIDSDTLAMLMNLEKAAARDKEKREREGRDKQPSLEDAEREVTLRESTLFFFNSRYSSSTNSVRRRRAAGLMSPDLVDLTENWQEGSGSCLVPSPAFLELSIWKATYPALSAYFENTVIHDSEPASVSAYYNTFSR
jgi:hypothetical protein